MVELATGLQTWIGKLSGSLTGDSLGLAFYKKYFSPHKTRNLRRQITSFQQSSTETLQEAWEIFKQIIRECPHHGFEKWFLVLQFHGGLFQVSPAILDSAAGGRFSEMEEVRA